MRSEVAPEGTCYTTIARLCAQCPMTRSDPPIGPMSDAHAHLLGGKFTYLRPRPPAVPWMIAVSHGSGPRPRNRQLPRPLQGVEGPWASILPPGPDDSRLDPRAPRLEASHKVLWASLQTVSKCSTAPTTAGYHHSPARRVAGRHARSPPVWRPVDTASATPAPVDQAEVVLLLLPAPKSRTTR